MLVLSRVLQQLLESGIDSNRLRDQRSRLVAPRGAAGISPATSRFAPPPPLLACRAVLPILQGTSLRIVVGIGSSLAALLAFGG